MKIIRHTARDMRNALRAVREQLGEDAVILSSRRTDEGVEVTAAVDFDASTLEAGGFTSPAAAPVAVQTVPSKIPAARREMVAKAATAPVPTRQPTARAPAARRSSLVHVVAEAAPAPEVAATDSHHSDWISAAAREAVIEHAQTQVKADLSRAQATAISNEPSKARIRSASAQPAVHLEPVEPHTNSHPQFAATSAETAAAAHARRNTDSDPTPAADDPVDPVTEAQTAALAPLGIEERAPTGGLQAPALSATAVDAMGNELKVLRRMLETQLAHLAWNDRTRRAPVQTEMLRELTEIGVIPDLAEHLVRQLPEDADLTLARRFTIAGLSQYLRVTGDHWLEDGGRVAFVGATGVGKTTTLAKIAVRWVLRHGARDIALVAADSVRIGAQDQLKSLAQLLGVPVYAPESFESLPALLSQLSERLILIDTPGACVRDAQLGGRLAVLANSASKLETALVLAASTQAGSVEEAVKHFAPVNPSCCVLTKVDEAASLGGVLSILIRARLPVSYLSEGQRVPEDLRPARALELVSAAVRLAKARGAAADEDLLRRRFGKNAHGIT